MIDFVRTILGLLFVINTVALVIFTWHKLNIWVMALLTVNIFADALLFCILFRLNL